MGLVKLLSLQDNWSMNDLYDLPLARNAMSRNRFEILLKLWHFADNTLAGNRFEILLKMWHFADNTLAGTSRIYKIEKIMNKFNSSIQKGLHTRLANVYR